MTERTFAIIKPDAVKARHAGRILARIEDAGFTIRGLRFTHLTKAEAEGFYAVHRERPFFKSLTEFMSSGACIVMALEAPDAIKKWRTLMGATDPAKAEAGTLRKEFGASIEHNATHGSDAPETAASSSGTSSAAWSCKVRGADSLRSALLIAVVGVAIELGLPVFRLPGDIVIKRGNATFYLPIVSCIMISVVLSILAAILRR